MSNPENDEHSNIDHESISHKLKWGLIRANKWHMLDELESKVGDELHDPVELESTLNYLREDVHVQLTKTYLRINRTKKEHSTISLKKDIYCTRRDPEDPAKFFVHALLDVYKRTVFHFTAKDSVEATKWISTIIQFVYDLELPIEKLPCRRILVIVNPLSGGRKGRKQFEEAVKPILDDSQAAGDINYTTIYTEYAGHATKICQQVNVADWDAIGCCGGDGCSHEGLTGLLERPDWRNASKIPICPIPCGTSNALASSFYGSDHALERSAFALVRGYQRPLDVCSVVQPGGVRIYSFLTVMFGFLANVTHKTEIIRKFNVASVRNMIGATKEIIEMPTYRAELSFVNFDMDTPIDLDDPNNANHMKFEHRQERTNLFRDIIKGDYTGFKNTPCEEDPDGPKLPLLSKFYPECFLTSKRGFVENVTGVDPRNKEFVRVDSEFFAVQSCNVSHIAANYPLAPTAYSNSEYMDLIWVPKEKASRVEFITKFIDLKFNEKKMYDDHMVTGKTQCFKLVPFDKGSFVSIDGEEADYVATYIEMHTKLCNVIVM
ncbi:sphingosine kinase 2 [Acrasis kona]|uniref:Sphingosine kinase 2 n=1 Tax=Acrasis kona TaxID=1008807 RepID=A0AAW2ZNZ3_9EUKA